MPLLFHDRKDAGKQLAQKLAAWRDRDDVTVLALPRGGVPVAFEIAHHLHAPLDLMLVRKLGVPGQEELAMGAIALPDIRVFNQDIIENTGISKQAIDKTLAEESAELARRNHVYRGDRPAPDLKNRRVILVDDGVATGATMRAALSAVAEQSPLRVIVAIPVASQEAYEMLFPLVDKILCLHTPAPFYGIGNFYEVFDQATDEEVIKCLNRANPREQSAA